MANNITFVPIIQSKLYRVELFILTEMPLNSILFKEFPWGGEGMLQTPLVLAISACWVMTEVRLMGR